MIVLEEGSFIGEGGLQKCYVHPNDENLCLKIVKEKEHPKLFRLDEEIKYYKKNQHKKIASFVSKYRGEVLTNIGIATIFDLIRDETTNEISLTVDDYLRMDNSPFSNELFEGKIVELKSKLINNKVIFRDFTTKNICCKVLKNNDIQLIIIDGLGNNDLLPVTDFFRFFARKKMNRIFKRRKLYSMKEHREWLAGHAPDIT